jgi:hypothetical protein
MAAPYNPPTKNENFVCHIALSDMAVAGSLKSNPTLASGDAKISKDGGAFANLATLPAVEPASSVSVRLELSSTEMNADEVLVVFIDQTTPKEWADWSMAIVTTT